MTRPPRKPRSVKVEDALWNAAKAAADSRGETLSDVIREALRRYSRVEAFTEMYSRETGYNLLHFRLRPVDEPDDAHELWEQCPCGPVRVTQNYVE